MKVTNRITDNQERIEITVAGHISQENACGIIQYAISEVLGQPFKELVLDLRKALFPFPMALFRLHSLMQIFKNVVLQNELRVTILFHNGNTEQWMYLDKASEFDGINMKYFTSPKAAMQFLSTDRHAEFASVH